MRKNYIIEILLPRVNMSTIFDNQLNTIINAGIIKLFIIILKLV